MAALGEQVRVDRKLNVNVNWIMEEMGVGQSFDVIRRDLEIAGRKATMFYVNGLVKDDVMTFILTSLAHLKPRDLTSGFFNLQQTHQLYTGGGGRSPPDGGQNSLRPDSPFGRRL